MNESSTRITRQRTPRASLAASGLKMQQLDLFGPIRHDVQIHQKTVRYTPTDKVYDAVIAILAGAHGMIESNTRVRSDPAVQTAVGRTGCAEQSVIQDTLDACDAATVTQMRQTLTTIYRRHSRGLVMTIRRPGSSRRGYDGIALWPESRLCDPGLLC